MTPTDALAAALRERLVDGRPAPLPGLGTLVRRHVSARVEDRPDGSRVLLPPGETVGLDPDGGGAGGSVAEAVARHRALPAAQAEDALDEAVREVRDALASDGEARLRGVGLLRQTDDGVVLGVEATLLESVNRAYEGLPAISTRPLPSGAEAPTAEGPDRGGAEDEPADEFAADRVHEAESPDLPALDFDDLLPHPTDGGGAAEPVDDGSIAPSAPPPPDEPAEGDPDERSEADGVLAVPFGAPDQTLADALPPTPPEHDPGDGGPSPEAAPAGDESFDDGPEAVALESSTPEGVEPDETDTGAPGPEGSPPKAPADTAWISNTWSAPGLAPPPPPLGDPQPPPFEEAEVLDDGAPALPPPSGDVEAPDDSGAGASLPLDDIAGLAVPDDEPVHDDVAPPATPPPRERRAPVERARPPAGSPTPPPVDTLRTEPEGAADRPPRPARATGGADEGEERSFPWWIPAALVLLGVVAVVWWAVSRPDPEAGAPLATSQETVQEPAEVASAQPEDDLLAPSSADDALSGPAGAAPPAATGQPPRVPGGEPVDADASDAGRTAGGAANPLPPALAGLAEDDQATLAGGALDVGERDTWTFVVASLRSRADADQVRRTYSEAGYKAAVLPLAGGFHRVGVGQFRSQAQALRLRDRLPPQAPPDTWVLSLRDL